MESVLVRTGSGHPLAGFSLLEMLVALAIAGILLAVALPGYEHAVRKSTRAAARATLLDVMSRQEQFFVNNKRYASAFGALGLPDNYYIDAQGQPAVPASAVYRIELALPGGSYDGAIAHPLNRQASDRACMAFSLSSTGVRSVSGALESDPRACW